MFTPRRILPLGLALLAFGASVTPAGAGSYVFSNPTNIALLESTNYPLTNASPYPSSIVVSGLTNQVISHLTVTLNGFSHTFPSDATVLLAGPTGKSAILMSEAGGQNADPVTGLTLVFDDSSHIPLPILDPLFSETFQPGALSLPLPFTMPAPAPSSSTNAGTALSVFNNTDPDGTWSLFIVDDSEGDVGSISGGWSVNITAGTPLGLKLAGTNVVFSWPTFSNQVFALQISSNLLNTNGWSNAPGSASLINGRNFQTNAAIKTLNSIRYYRLLGQ